MKIAIIGGSGFVGSRLIPEISKEEIVNIDKRDSFHFKDLTTLGDITSKNFSIPSNIDCVILLAAEHKDNVEPISLYYKVNVEGTRNVLEQMDVIGCKKLIFTSSVAVYGLNKKNPDENHEIDPFNHYGKSKWQAEQLIMEWYKKNPSNKSVSIIRPTVIFGENNRGNVYNLLKTIVDRKFIMIGDGMNLKSMAYVGNVTSFIKEEVYKSEAGFNVYNYVDKPDISMIDLVKVVENTFNIKTPKFKLPIMIGYFLGILADCFNMLFKKKLPISSVRIKKFTATTQFDATKAHSDTWVAPFTLEEGLNQTLLHEFSSKRHHR